MLDLLIHDACDIVSPGQGVRNGCSRLLQGAVDKHLIQSVPTALVHVGFERLRGLCQRKSLRLSHETLGSYLKRVVAGSSAVLQQHSTIESPTTIDKAS